MMDRRIFLTTVAGLLLTPLAAEAQQAGKIARVGFLFFGPAWSPEVLAQAVRSPFWLSMRELGWVYGQNVVAERRFGESADQLHIAAADLARLKVDVVVVATAGLAKIAQMETKDIPIVVGGTGADLVAAGLVASLARPGGTVTRIQVLSDELIGKGLECLKALAPNLSRVAWLRDDVTWSAVPQTGARYDEQAAVAARTLGIVLHPLVVHQVGELDAAFLSMMKNRDQGLVVVGSPFIWVHRMAIIELATKHRIAAIYEFRDYVEAGGLISYGRNGPEMSRRVVFYVDKILKGAKPGDLPIEQATKFELVINLKTAKALGLTIPPSLLGRADEVIE